MLLLKPICKTGFLSRISSRCNCAYLITKISLWILSAQCKYVWKVFSFLWNVSIPLSHSGGRRVSFPPVFEGTTVSAARSGVCGAAARSRRSWWRRNSAASWRTERRGNPALRPAATSGWTPRPASGRSPAAGVGGGKLNELPEGVRERGATARLSPAEAADAADAPPGQTPQQRGLARPCGMEHVAVPHVLLLGVSAPGGPAEALTYIFNHVVYFFFALAQPESLRRVNESIHEPHLCSHF